MKPSALAATIAGGLSLLAGLLLWAPRGVQAAPGGTLGAIDTATGIPRVEVVNGPSEASGTITDVQFTLSDTTAHQLSGQATALNSLASSAIGIQNSNSSPASSILYVGSSAGQHWEIGVGQSRDFAVASTTLLYVKAGTTGEVVNVQVK